MCIFLPRLLFYSSKTRPATDGCRLRTLTIKVLQSSFFTVCAAGRLPAIIATDQETIFPFVSSNLLAHVNAIFGRTGFTFRFEPSPSLKGISDRRRAGWGN